MSLLDIYSKGTITGTGGPSAKRQKELDSELSKYQSKGGSTYAETLFTAQRAGENALTSMTPMGQLATGTNYITSTFKQATTRGNSLVKKSITNNNYGPGKFATDIVSYTDRQFMIANASLGQASIIPSVLATAAKTAPVLTPIDSKNSTNAGMGGVVSDGRYDLTVGFGYVLYNTRGTYQS